MQELKIDEEFKNLIRPLYRQEYLQLEANLIEDGCRDPITIWNGVIVDGHNRYEICTKHKIPFRTEEKDFTCREEAIAWICANQLGRRNLTEETRKFLIGMQYENEKIVNERKNVLGRNQYSSPDSSPNDSLIQNDLSAELPSRNKTAHKIANDYHISRATVEKYASYTRALESIGKKEPNLVPKILSGRYKISHNGVIELSSMPASEVQSINRRLERAGPEYARYQATRKEIQQARDVRSSKELSESVPSVKDMPVFDPDAEVIGLSLTIPSWASSICRVENATDFTFVSQSAKQKLQSVLIDLLNSGVHMLHAFRGEHQ